MTIHSTILAWRIPWNSQRSLLGYSPWGRKELDTTEQLTLSLFTTLKASWVIQQWQKTSGKHNKQKTMCSTVELFSVMCLPHC